MAVDSSTRDAPYEQALSSLSPLQRVKESTRAFVGHRSSQIIQSQSLTNSSPAHVSIDELAIENELTRHPHLYSRESLPPTWAQWYHYHPGFRQNVPADVDGNVDAYAHSNGNPTVDSSMTCEQEQLLVQYIFVLDSLNFCFWPLLGYEYAQLASSLKRVLLHDPAAFAADRLLHVTTSELAQWLQPLRDEEEIAYGRHHLTLPSTPTHSITHALPLAFSNSISVSSSASATGADALVNIPLIELRCLALHELGAALILHFDGLAANLLLSARHSAAALVSLIATHLPMFRDHSIDPLSGSPCYFYKRAQILVADLFGAFRGHSFGSFTDINELTCFADYRLPQLLSHIGILKYDETLQDLIVSGHLIPAGSEMELSIRAHLIQAVEMMRTAMKRLWAHEIKSIELDWILWERGEAMLQYLPPHHRTLTVYY